MGKSCQGEGLEDDACANCGCRTSGCRMGRRNRNYGVSSDAVRGLERSARFGATL